MKCDKKDLLLYAVTDRHWLNGRTLYSQVEEALKGGATFIQLREKELDEEHFLEEAKEIKELCRRYQVPFVINDNVEIALAVDADGVHVGQSDMEAGDVRAKLGPDKMIGVSAQTVEQAVMAEQNGADYLGVGAVFPTGSKADALEAHRPRIRKQTILASPLYRKRPSLRWWKKAGASRKKGRRCLIRTIRTRMKLRK